MKVRHMRWVAGCLLLLFALGAGACGGKATVPESAQATPAKSAEVAAPAAEAPAAVAAAPSPPKASGRKGNEKLAPELTDTTGWINSEPFTLESQRGKVVLIDFWTYTCVNCIRTFPYLKSWHAKYASKGLVILGVHTPEFNFEKIRENVVVAMEKFGLTYAVVQDNNYGTWTAFNNHFWPSKYLIDKDGYIRYTHHGEGGYDETEARIRELLGETGADLSSISPDTPAPPALAVPAAVLEEPATGLTREMYAGFLRNYNLLNSLSTPPYVLHEEYYDKPNVDVLYKDPGSHSNHFIYLQGLWRNAPDSLIHARETQDYEDYVAIKFTATAVNAVMAPASAGPFEVRLTIDGKPLKREQAGVDVRFHGDDSSYVPVNEARMYRLLELPEYAAHELKLSSNSPEMALFAFTFGAYETGP